jgi:LmbE family N-acetylglucosaminyl deacetylase
VLNALNGLSGFDRHRRRGAQDFGDSRRSRVARPIKALLVNAHPDDESESAAVVYRITHESGGTVDQMVVTNGEGGQRYATLAEAFYRLPLTTAGGRRELLGPIRREELMRASRILGIRHSYFLNQKDTGVTLSAADAFEAWDIERIRQELRALLEFGHYNLVLVLLPAADTHGHHQTVAVLTLEAVAGMKTEHKPALLGVRTAPPEATDPVTFSELRGYPLTRTTAPEPFWSFDRRTPLACDPSLNYGIVVNWVVAEHKSQGFFQLENGRRTHEHFWLFEAAGKAGAARSRDFVNAMERNSVARDCVGVAV